MFGKHRLFSYQHFNSPESIQARNKEKLLADFKKKAEVTAATAPKRMRTKLNIITNDKSIAVDDLDKHLEDDAAAELGLSSAKQKRKSTFQPAESIPHPSEPTDPTDLKFMPLPPQVREAIASPVGKFHTRGARVARLSPIENYDGVQDMLIIFDAIRKQPHGTFQYFTHSYPKNSVNYNFYNVK